MYSVTLVILTITWHLKDKFHVPFRLEKCPVIGNFCGREADLEKMRENLPAVLEETRQRVLVLHGLGGMGKSQIALQFARKFQDQYTAVFWLESMDEQVLDGELASLAERIPVRDVLDVNGRVIDSMEAISKAKAAVLGWLALKGNSRWLIIFDNVISPDTDDAVWQPEFGDERLPGSSGFDIRPYFETLGQGSIIITTRQLHMAQLGQGMEIGRMSPEASIELLKSTSQEEAEAGP